MEKAIQEARRAQADFKRECDEADGVVGREVPHYTRHAWEMWHAIDALIFEIDYLRTHQRHGEDQLCWLVDWCRDKLGIDNNSMIGRDGWPNRLVEVVARAAEEKIAELRKPNWYWDDRCLETSRESIAKCVECDSVGDVIELRPLHELPTIRVRVTEEGWEEVE